MSAAPTKSGDQSIVGTTTSSDKERLAVSVDEAAELLGISRSFAYELCARGELPALRLGRRLVVPRRALLELVDAAEAAFHGQL